jgi:N-acetylglutamate synthase
MAVKISEMKIKDYDEVYALWQNTEGVGLFSHTDSKQSISKFLKRNRGLSFVARNGRNIVGVVLCGHDCRRAYIYHLAVERAFRNKGVGTKLVNGVIRQLKSINIPRCHLFVFNDNQGGYKFWEKLGWNHLPGFKFMSRPIGNKDKIVNRKVVNL